MGSKEILTLQFGHYANFVGAHWWNCQELGFDYDANAPSEIDHDVLFREGVAPTGQATFTPRLLLVDLKGSLKRLPQQGDLYDSMSEVNSGECEWAGNVTVEEEEKGEFNAFQKRINDGKYDINNFNLDEQVNVWSDFLYSRFHPRTVNIVKQYQHKIIQPAFDIYPLGCQLWKTEQFQEDFTDKIRNYIEECDSFQGFHVLFDSVDSFSGLSSSCIQYLRDEYSTKAILAFPLISSTELDDSVKITNKIVNLALTFANLAEFSSLFVPLSTHTTGWRQCGPKREFNHINYNNNLFYHSSALLASALDTFTLKYRLKSMSYSLTDLCADLNSNGRKAAAGSLCLPFSMNKVDDLIDCLDHWDGPLSKSITPNCEIKEDKVMQLYTLRGIPESRLKRPPNQTKTQQNLSAYKCQTVKEMLSFYVACNSYASATHVTTVNGALPVKTPYPKIFDNHVNINGNIDVSHPIGLVESVPVLSGLHNGNFVGEMIESLHNEVRKIKIKKAHQFFLEEIDEDEYKECLNRILQLRECYEDNYLL